MLLSGVPLQNTGYVFKEISDTNQKAVLPDMIFSAVTPVVPYLSMR